MRTLLLGILIFFTAFSCLFAQVVVIDNFDSSAVNDVYTINSEGPPTVVNISDNHTDFTEGTGSLNFNAVLGAIHPWGTFAELQNPAPEGTYFDWAVNDTLSLWIKVYEAPTLPENMFFRVQLQDQPTPGDDAEMWVYENAVAVDNQTDWYELKIPLVALPSDGNTPPSDSGFTVTPLGWGLPHNNEQLDLDKLISYGLVTVTNAEITDSLKIGYDFFVRTGSRPVPFVIFNGMAVPNNLSLFVWGQSVVFVEEGTGATPGTNSLKWIQGDEWGNGWTGFGYDIAEPLNLGGAWSVDSLKFKMKAPAGTGPVRAQFESGPDGKVGTVFQPIDDGQWHDYAFPLSEFVPQDETASFDSTAIVVFGFMAEASGVAGTEIYFDDVWTGNPVIDVVGPAAPTNVIATPGNYVNIVTWTDVPGETGEIYSVYYSENPITDIHAPGVEVAGYNIPENTELVNHLLRAPVDDQNVTYYYAVVATDEAGNIGDISDNTSAITNLAKGVTIINPAAPPNFAADGDLSDWASITPFRMFPSDGSGTVVTNTTIDGDDDLSVWAYVAMDDQYLYVAFDVTDDIVATDTTKPSYLIDSPDLFLGLYNWHGAPHTFYQSGAEPDYHFRFGRNALMLDNAGGFRLLNQGDPDYYWDEKFEPGYIVEAKIALSAIAAVNGDSLFIPAIGMRIPIDFAINDADATGEREGILTYSPFNEDQSWQDVSRWLYTWYGASWTGVEADGENVVLTYSLEQNYPNPFNPSTQIQYTLEKAGNVSLKVYDMLGREVASLVDENQSAGKHIVNFNAANFATGVYLYRLKTGSFIQVKKMLLLK